MDEISIVSADPIDPEEFLQLVCSLGGDYRPDQWTDGRLSRGSRHVWLTVDPDSIWEPEEERLAAYEKKLRHPVASRVVLSIARAQGSDRVAVEIIEAAAERWRIVVDDYHHFLLTPEELCTRLAELGPEDPVFFVAPAN